MEETKTSSLFSLTIDPSTKAHLSETARWARFLAITGMISLALVVIFGLLYSIWISTMVDSMQNQNSFQTAQPFATGLAFGSAILFIIVASVAFFPLLYMFRFANQMKTALYGNDQELLNRSFQNLKKYFRYLGIITIISLAMWLVWLLVFGVAIFSLV